VGWRLEGPTVGSVLDHSTALENHERLAETVVVDAEHFPEFDSGLRCGRTSQRLADSLCEGRCGRLDVSLFDHLKVGLTALVDEPETDRVGPDLIGVQLAADRRQPRLFGHLALTGKASVGMSFFR